MPDALASLLPLLLIATSLVPAVLILALGERRQRARIALNVGGAVLKLLLVVGMLYGTARGGVYEWRSELMPGVPLVLEVGPTPLLFVSLSALLWLFTTIYAIAYLEGSPHRARFFAFFSLCVTATVGIALAGNLITFLLFYELLTVATWPLVVHRGSPQALAAGRTYLGYLVPGGALLLAAVAWLYALAGPVEFQAGGALDAVAAEHPWQLRGIFVLLVAGLGFKAALVPLHGWLPAAMVAPAPVSALLHAVAVVKAGAYGIVRVVLDLYGSGLARDLDLLTPLAMLASVTIIYGSLRALTHDSLKRRLAYSTVSQVSYIIVGVAIVGAVSTTGGLVHLVHQGLMKVTLFYCAGNLAETQGLTRVSELRGTGRRMPVTMGAFTIAALGMIGVPPLAGFVSKWYLGLGALDAGAPWVVAVLVASTLLNAAYFLPIIYYAWFCEPDRPWPGSPHPTPYLQPQRRAGVRLESHWALLLPPAATALLTIGAGLFAGSSLSPLQWAESIARTVYREAGL